MPDAVELSDRPPRVVLLVPSETYRATSFMAAADAVGAEVIVATEHVPPMAAEMENRLVQVDFERPVESAARIAALGERTPIDAVVGVDDKGVLTAAHAAAMLGRPHNPPDSVAATRNKVDMRSVLASWNVPQPAFRVVGPDSDVAALAEEVGLPCVVKPVSLSASTGVIRADSTTEAEAVAARVRDILESHGHPRDEIILIERFVGGREVSVEGLLSKGELHVLAIFDKPDPMDGPYFEETIYLTPSQLPSDDQDAVLSAVASACRALGLCEGPVHAELRVDRRSGASSAVVLEVAARSIGGLCSRVLRFGAGVSLEELIVRHALGLETEYPSDRAGAAGVMMLPIPGSGVLVDVRGEDSALAIPGITGLEITATIGRPIEALPEGGKYLGFLFGRAETPSEVEASLREAHAQLQIRIVDPTASDCSAADEHLVAAAGEQSEHVGHGLADVRVDRTERNVR